MRFEALMGMGGDTSSMFKWRGNYQGEMIKSDSSYWCYYTNYDYRNGFNALPTGIRGSNGTFDYLCGETIFWLGTGFSPEFLQGRLIDLLHYNIYRGSFTRDLGASCRCVKD